MQALEFQRTNAFKAPPKEWVDHKSKQLVEILNLNTKTSALALKELLGTIELEPVAGECTIQLGKVIQNRPFYMVYTTIDNLAGDMGRSSNFSMARIWRSSRRAAAFCSMMYQASSLFNLF